MDPISINTLKGITPAEIKPKLEETKTTGGADFKKTISEFINQVNETQQNADKAIENTVFNEGADIADTIIALEKAKISFQLMVNIRNSLLQSYQEIMRMQV